MWTPSSEQEMTIKRREIMDVEQGMNNNRKRREIMDVEQGMNNSRRYIPPEIVVEILLHLPIKSALRFSSVSKSWKSLILDPNFRKKRTRLVMSPNWRIPWYDTSLADLFSCSLSSIFSDAAVPNATPIISPIEGPPTLQNLRASSGELWCVEFNGSLYLWNPSFNNAYKKIPPSISCESPRWRVCNILYGLGYDSVNDDYKILKTSTNLGEKSELYSLRSDSWRMIDVLPPFYTEEPLHQECVFVDGSLHWVKNFQHRTILSFELATETYGRVAPPPEGPTFVLKAMAVFRGKLCAVGRREKVFVLWVMEEYGVEKSWTKKFDFKHCDVIHDHYNYTLIPLHIFDNGQLLLIVCTFFEQNHSALFIYKGDETGPGTPVWREICHRFAYNERKMTMVCRGISNGLMYEESYFSPAAWAKAGRHLLKRQKLLNFT